MEQILEVGLEFRLLYMRWYENTFRWSRLAFAESKHYDPCAIHPANIEQPTICIESWHHRFEAA